MTSSTSLVQIMTATTLILQAAPASEENALPRAKPVPDVQVLPLPYDQASFQYLGEELTRFHFGHSLKRPFLYPLIGPGERSYTRMGHPHDPVGHSHHNSVWISHKDVDGVDFWGDRNGSRILCERVEEYHDGSERAWMLCVNAWQDAQGQTLMNERRRIAVEPLKNGEWQMLIDMQLEAPGDKPVTLRVTPFGLIGIRMAKTIGVRDGGGRILDSEGRLNEKGIFRKPARWVDYSGPVARGVLGGITLMDHPANPTHPTPFHVRDDGWMGACLTLERPQVIEPGHPLRLRYAMWVHGGVPAGKEVEPRWREFARSALPDLQPRR